jgi:hypothetical protein
MFRDAFKWQIGAVAGLVLVCAITVAIGPGAQVQSYTPLTDARSAG